MKTGDLVHRATRFVYRVYRALKNDLQHRNSFVSKLFFRLLAAAEIVLSEHSFIRSRKRHNDLWKRSYSERFRENVFQVRTAYPIASDSIDHTSPRGAVRDSSTNPRFLPKMYELLGRKTNVKLLDMGCAGGGFVRSVLEDNNTAVGLEGSDTPKRLGLGEWANCPHHLFTCDITRDFQICDAAGNPVTFDIITAWEVLEHIPRERLPALIENVRRHLTNGGYFVASVDQTPDINPLTGAVYHLTVEGFNWWLAQFRPYGFSFYGKHPFAISDYVRGSGLGLKNWDPHDGDGFHLVLHVEQ